MDHNWIDLVKVEYACVPLHEWYHREQNFTMGEFVSINLKWQDFNTPETEVFFVCLFFACCLVLSCFVFVK